MTERDRREKASDVFAGTKFLFGEKVGFSEAFPRIKKLDVVVEESGEGVSGRTRERHYDHRGIGEYVDCSNPLCYKGGVQIGATLRAMYAGRETEAEYSALCQGYEGSPKGRRKDRDCANFFKVHIAAEYEPESVAHT